MHRIFLNRKIAGRAFLAVNTVTLPVAFSTAVCEGEKAHDADLLAQIKKASEAFISPEELEAISRNINANFRNSGLQQTINESVPALEDMPVQDISYGFLMGYSSGFCIKKLSKVVAFGVGGVFIVIQTLNYNGYATINQDKLSSDVKDVLDLNCDGVVDGKDAQIAYNKLDSYLSYNMPAGGGFSTGLLFGLRA